MKRILPLAALAALALAVLFWWPAGQKPRPEPGGIVTVQAPGGRPARTGTDALALMEKQILEAIDDPGTRIRDTRIVDQKRLIVCGERIDQPSATPRRFVWLSQIRQLVTDDGGQNFAILVNVCNPPPSEAAEPY